MQVHSVVLMKDGEVIESDRPSSLLETAGCVGRMLKSIAGAGCYRLTVDGYQVNGRLCFDVPATPRNPAEERGTFAQRRHGGKRV